MTHTFTRAPIIARTHTHGTYAEGYTDDADLLITFEHAIDTFGFLIQRGQRMTGSQWVEAIKKSYGMNDARTRAVIDAVRAVMLVKEFEDDSLLFDASGVAIFRGAASDCSDRSTPVCTLKPVAQATPMEVESAELVMAQDDIKSNHDARLGYVPANRTAVDLLSAGRAFSTSFWDMPTDHLVVISADEQPEKSLLARMHRLLRRPPIGPDSFNEDESSDREANLTLMMNLMRYQGYENLVTAGSWRGGPRPQRDVTNIDFSSADQVEAAVRNVFDSLVDGEWDESKPVFLCRPAPIVNPLASIRPFESVVHHKLIGWRLPQGLVETFAQEARERFNQASRVRESAA